MSNAPRKTPVERAQGSAENEPNIQVAPAPLWQTPGLADAPWSADWAEELFQSSICGTNEARAVGPNVAEVPVAPSAEDRGQVGHYRILKGLGTGGMGTVFLAEDTQLRRRVALKVLRRDKCDPESRQRFLREARLTAAIKHDHVVTIYNVGEKRGLPFLAMELLKGTSLDVWLKQGKTLTLGQILRVGREAALGLASAHERGLVHRDIKPGNLWLEAPNGRIKILDFGLARPFEDDAHLTTVGMVVGTPAYMAPEQAIGATVDARCDIFSLGVVLYRLVTGQLPFQAFDPVGVLKALVESNPTPVQEIKPETPRPLAELIMKMLAKKPADRPQSMLDVAEGLKGIDQARRDRSQPVPAAAPAGSADVWRHATGSGSRRLSPLAEELRHASRQRFFTSFLVFGCLAVLVPAAYLGLMEFIGTKPGLRKADELSKVESDAVTLELAALRKSLATASQASDKAAIAEALRSLQQFHDKYALSADPRIREMAALAKELITFVSKTANVPANSR